MGLRGPWGTAGDADLGDTYYRHWLDALEQLTIAKGLADADRLHARLVLAQRKRGSGDAEARAFRARIGPQEPMATPPASAALLMSMGRSLCSGLSQTEPT